MYVPNLRVWLSGRFSLKLGIRHTKFAKYGIYYMHFNQLNFKLMEVILLWMRQMYCVTHYCVTHYHVTSSNNYVVLDCFNTIYLWWRNNFSIDKTNERETGEIRGNCTGRPIFLTSLWRSFQPFRLTRNDILKIKGKIMYKNFSRVVLTLNVFPASVSCEKYNMYYWYV